MIEFSVTRRMSIEEDSKVLLEIHVEGLNVSPAIFAVEKLPDNAPTRRFGKHNTCRFSHVCDTAELDSFPEVPDKAKPYFRTSCVSMVLFNRKQAEHTFGIILADIRKLAERLRAQESAPFVTDTFKV